jgi:SAM-dependent methyltransferase
MKKYSASTYGDKIADVYDFMYAAIDQAMIDTLVFLSGKTKALELGIGTGRVALPLFHNGVKIQGIDSSRSMVAKMRRKPDGKKIPVQFGDFADFDYQERFGLIFIVFNTFFGLQTQEDQINCFRCVSKVLRPGGKFVIEAFVPDTNRFDRGQTLRTISVTDDLVRLECSSHDVNNQSVVSQIVCIGEKSIKLYPVRVRYVWPSEMDLMAQLAGLRRVERWANWKRETFGSGCGSHISVYGK